MQLMNVSSGVLVAGQPLLAVGNHGVRLGGGDSGTVFAICGSNGGPRQMVDVITSGTVERTDWGKICGEKNLTAGAKYYVGVLGKLTKNAGTIEVGTADSLNRLTVNVMVAPVATGTGEQGEPGPAGAPGADGVDASGYLDGGYPESVYGGVSPLNGGTI